MGYVAMKISDVLKFWYRASTIVQGVAHEAMLVGRKLWNNL